MDEYSKEYKQNATEKLEKEIDLLARKREKLENQKDSAHSFIFNYYRETSQLKHENERSALDHIGFFSKKDSTIAQALISKVVWSTDNYPTTQLRTSDDRYEKKIHKIDSLLQLRANERINLISESDVHNSFAYNNGIISKIAVLHELKNQNNIWPAFYSILMLFLILEIAPIISKLIMSSGEYDLSVKVEHEIHKNKLDKHKSTLFNVHNAYFNRVQGENIEVFNKFMDQLKPKRIDHITLQIETYIKGHPWEPISKLFERIRLFVINDMPEEIGNKTKDHREFISQRPEGLSGNDSKTGDKIEEKKASLKAIFEDWFDENKRKSVKNALTWGLSLTVMGILHIVQPYPSLSWIGSGISFIFSSTIINSHQNKREQAWI